MIRLIKNYKTALIKIKTALLENLFAKNLKPCPARSKTPGSGKNTLL